MTPFLSRTFQSTWFRILLIVALVALYVAWIGYQYIRNQLFDFNVYYISAHGFRQGIDIYSLVQDYTTTNYPRWEALAQATGVEAFTAPYLYPPLTAQLAAFLLPLPPRTAGMVWLGLTALAFLASAILIGRFARSPEGPTLAYLLLLLFVPPLTTLHAGQVNGFLLLALVVSMVGLARRSAFLAGLGIALGTLLKLIPIVLLGYLLWRKQWRAALIAVLLIVCILLTAPLTFAPDTLSSYFRHLVDVARPGTLFFTPPNQSLNGFWARSLDGMVAEPTIYRFYLISVLAVVGATIFVCFPPRSLPRYWTYEFAFIVCALQLITPYTWYHQLALLYIPLFLIIDRLWHDGAWAWLALIILLLVLTNIHGLFWHSFREFAALTSFPFLLTMTLWGMLALFIRQARQEESSSAPGVHPIASSEPSA